jgi:hypothetical protein
MAGKPVLLIALLAAGCMHPPPLPGMPTRAGLESGLMPVDVCAGAESMCDPAPTPDRIRVVASRCAPLPPRDGNPRAACRVTWKQIYYGGRVREYRKTCVELIRRGDARGGAPYWGWDYQAVGGDRACRDRGV